MNTKQILWIDRYNPTPVQETRLMEKFGANIEISTLDIIFSEDGFLPTLEKLDNAYDAICAPHFGRAIKQAAYNLGIQLYVPMDFPKLKEIKTDPISGVKYAEYGCEGINKITNVKAV